MNWWGKLIGGAFGFMLGGPLGALLGAAVGHKFDSGLQSVLTDAARGAEDVQRTQSAFFAATFSIMGHLAKADGVVTGDEINAARNIMAQMQLNEEQQRAAVHLFNEGKRPDFPLDEVLRQFKTECHGQRALVQLFLEIQITTVMADGVVHTAERSLLQRIGIQLGFNATYIEQLIMMVQAQSFYSHQGSYRQTGRPTARKTDTLKTAYEVLGLEQNAPDTDVKKAYRRLMNQHHPDKLVAKGLPEEMMKIANEKTQEIKEAYEHIKAARQLK
jgi:DnaJ like chaperone protein